MSTQKAGSPQSAGTCPPCLPFCGLNNGLGLTERIKACGASLLEQLHPGKPAAPASPKNA